MCKAPIKFQFILFSTTFTMQVLTLIIIEAAHLENDVTFVVNCYDVVSPTPNYCKSDISEHSGVEKFVRI
jgi:hypothetical protein